MLRVPRTTGISTRGLCAKSISSCQYGPEVMYHREAKVAVFRAPHRSIRSIQTICLSFLYAGPPTPLWWPPWTPMPPAFRNSRWTTSRQPSAPATRGGGSCAGRSRSASAESVRAARPPPLPPHTAHMSAAYDQHQRTPNPRLCLYSICLSIAQEEKAQKPLQLVPCICNTRHAIRVSRLHRRRAPQLGPAARCAHRHPGAGGAVLRGPGHPGAGAGRAAHLAPQAHRLPQDGERAAAVLRLIQQGQVGAEAGGLDERSAERREPCGRFGTRKGTLRIHSQSACTPGRGCHWLTVHAPCRSLSCRCSTAVTARRPFGRDPTLDYEVASDDEWEEEPEVRGPYCSRRSCGTTAANCCTHSLRYTTRDLLAVAIRVCSWM